MKRPIEPSFGMRSRTIALAPPALIALCLCLGSCGTLGDDPSSESSSYPRLNVDDGSGQASTDCPGFGGATAIADYVEIKPRTGLEFIPDDLSGLTYNYDSDTLYMIRNNLTTIWETTTSYELVRTINTTENFGDSEGIAYLGNNEYAIVSEEGILYVGHIPPGSSDIVVSPDDFQKLTISPDGGTQGPEGVAFDSATQRFFVVKEENPRKILSFVRPDHSRDTVVDTTEPYDAQRLPYPRLTQDMSGVLFVPATGRLLVLSHRDHRVMDIALDGKVHGLLDFPEGQYEGIAFDCEKNLHLVGERNFYHVFGPD